MVFLHPQILDLDLAYTREDFTYTFASGLPAGLTPTVSNAGVVDTVGYDHANGSALRLTIPNNTATATVTGPKLGRSVIRAACIDVEGISLSDTNSPLFGIGLYEAVGFAHYAEIYRTDAYAGLVTAQKAAGNRTIVSLGGGGGSRGTDYDAGLLINYDTNTVTGHVGHSYGQTTNPAHIPGTDLYFKIRALGSTAPNFDFSVYFRKITLSVWR